MELGGTGWNWVELGGTGWNWVELGGGSMESGENEETITIIKLSKVYKDMVY